MAYCENNGLDVFKYLPVTILMQYDNTNFLNQFEKFSYLFNNIKNFVESPGTNSTGLNKVNKDRRYNTYFNFNFSSSDKTGSKTHLYIQPTHYIGKNLWLIKAVDLNRGRCIRIGDNLSRIQKIIKKFYDGMAREFKECEEEDQDNNTNIYEKEETNNQCSQNINPVNNITEEKRSPSVSPDKKTNRKSKYKASIIIVQKYLESPLTYKNRKFDIRLWVLLTHKMEVYAFR
jgi:hypothetical protein